MHSWILQPCYWCTSAGSPRALTSPRYSWPWRGPPRGTCASHRRCEGHPSATLQDNHHVIVNHSWAVMSESPTDNVHLLGLWDGVEERRLGRYLAPVDPRAVQVQPPQSDSVLVRVVALWAKKSSYYMGSFKRSTSIMTTVECFPPLHDCGLTVTVTHRPFLHQG